MLIKKKAEYYIYIYMDQLRPIQINPLNEQNTWKNRIKEEIELTDQENSNQQQKNTD